jgi:hypothetical protein
LGIFCAWGGETGVIGFGPGGGDITGAGVPGGGVVAATAIGLGVCPGSFGIIFPAIISPQKGLTNVLGCSRIKTVQIMDRRFYAETDV